MDGIPRRKYERNSMEKSIYLSINFIFNRSCFNLLDKKTPSQQALEAIHSHSSGALLGSRGLRSLSHAKKTTSISGKKSFFASLGDSFELSVLNTGTDIFCFPQFEGSPHVRYDMICYVTNFSLHFAQNMSSNVNCLGRYHKSVLYQGEWAGVPLLTPMV